MFTSNVLHYKTSLFTPKVYTMLCSLWGRQRGMQRHLTLLVLGRICESCESHLCYSVENYLTLQGKCILGQFILIMSQCLLLKERNISFFSPFYFDFWELQYFPSPKIKATWHPFSIFSVHRDSVYIIVKTKNRGTHWSLDLFCKGFVHCKETQNPKEMSLYSHLFHCIPSRTYSVISLLF